MQEPLITGEVLRKVCTALSAERADVIAQLINEECPGQGIDTRDILQEFVARCAVESREFQTKSENLNYSAQGLANTWPGRYAVDPAAKVKVPNEKAKELARNPEAIANATYSGRLGNTRPGDGWAMRGGAFIQATGRTMYEAIGRAFNVTAEQAAELCRNDDRFAMKVSAWIFITVKGLKDEAIAEDIKAIVKAINGGLLGLHETQVYEERALKYIV